MVRYLQPNILVVQRSTQLRSMNSVSPVWFRRTLLIFVSRCIFTFLGWPLSPRVSEVKKRLETFSHGFSVLTYLPVILVMKSYIVVFATLRLLELLCTKSSFHYKCILLTGAGDLTKTVHISENQNRESQIHYLNATILVSTISQDPSSEQVQGSTPWDLFGESDNLGIKRVDILSTLMD